MHYFLKTLVFVASVLLVFTYIAYSIPSQPSLPPEEGSIDFEAVKTKNDLVFLGQKIFFGKGKCALCHTLSGEGGRCPNLAGIGAKLSRDFIYESLTNPQAFVYKQYQYNPPKHFGAVMPAVNKPPIGLSDNELLAVIAFIQSTGGPEYVTVDPSELVKPAEAVIMVAGDPKRGASVFRKLGCRNCHGESKIQSKEKIISDLVPKSQQGNAIFLLGALQESRTADHKGFSARLSLSDLNDLAGYLAGFKTVTEDM